MRHSLYNVADAKVGYQSTISTATTTKGTTVDLAGAGIGVAQSALVLVLSGAVTDGTAYTWKLQHSDTTTDGDFVDVPAELLQGTLAAYTTSDDNVLRQQGYVGPKRYVRAVCTSTGSPSTGAVFTVLILRGYPRRQPITHS